MGHSVCPAPGETSKRESREVFPHFGCGCELLGRKWGRKTRTPALGFQSLDPERGQQGAAMGARGRKAVTS